MQTTPLEKARAQKGWTQDQLAEAAGVSRYTILRAEKGQAPGRYATCLKLAHALALEPEDLFDIA